MKLGLGIIISFTLFFGLVFAAGFHYPGEIFEGTFLGNYTFDGNVNVTGNLNGNIPGSIPSCNENETLTFSGYGSSSSIICQKTLGLSSSDPGSSCYNILETNSNLGSGMYWIDVDGIGGVSPFEVYCDMETDGGGWTRIKNLSERYDQIDSNLFTFSRTQNGVDYYSMTSTTSQFAFGGCSGGTITGYAIGVSNHQNNGGTYIDLEPQINYSEMRLRGHWWGSSVATLGGVDILSNFNCGSGISKWAPDEIINVGLSKDTHVAHFQFNSGVGGSQDGFSEIWVR